MHLLRWPFLGPCGSDGTMPSASHSGYPRCHWMPQSGQYLSQIVPADAMVINFGVKNWIVALWKSLFEASVQKAQNWPSIQLFEAMSCVERSNATIKAKELSYLSSYQTLTTDKNWWSYQSPMKLVIKWSSQASIAVNSLTAIEACEGQLFDKLLWWLVTSTIFFIVSVWWLER